MSGRPLVTFVRWETCSNQSWIAEPNSRSTVSIGSLTARAIGSTAERARLGFVETVIVGENPPDDTCLAVRAGWLGRKVVLVPLSSVAFIVPQAERIWLRTPDCS